MKKIHSDRCQDSLHHTWNRSKKNPEINYGMFSLKDVGKKRGLNRVYGVRGALLLRTGRSAPLVFGELEKGQNENTEF